MDEQRAGREPLSQLGRAPSELGVVLIPAHLPQAKGRVARLVQTVQDRLVKERRLAGVSALEAANRFLEGDLPLDTQRVAVPPAQAADLHRPHPAHRELDRTLCLKTTRCLRKDFPLAHQRGLSQTHETIRAAHVLVEARGDGTRQITHQGRPLGDPAITSRPMKAGEAKTVPQPRCPVTPRPDHPWRPRLWPARTSHAAAAGT